MNDQYYIQKVIEGDSEFFRYLVDKYKDKAFSVAFSVLRNSTFTEDVVQDSFIKAYTKISTFRGDAAFSTWLMRIVVNESIKVLRKKKIEIESQKELAFVVEMDINKSVNFLKDEEQRVFIDSTMAQMPQREALVLQLYYLNEQSLKEMEDIMKLRSDHLKVILHRARKRFYNILKDELKHELKSII